MKDDITPMYNLTTALQDAVIGQKNSIDAILEGLDKLLQVQERIMKELENGN